MQYQKKPTSISSVAPPQIKVNLMQMQMQSQPRAFGLGGSMIDAVKKSRKGCKSCGG